MKGNEWSPEQVHPDEPAVLIVANRGPNSVTNTGPSPPAAHVTVDVLLPTPPRREVC